MKKFHKTGNGIVDIVIWDELSVKISEWLRTQPDEALLATRCSDTAELTIWQDETNTTNFSPDSSNGKVNQKQQGIGASIHNQQQRVFASWEATLAIWLTAVNMSSLPLSRKMFDPS